MRAVRLEDCAPAGSRAHSDDPRNFASTLRLTGALLDDPRGPAKRGPVTPNTAGSKPIVEVIGLPYLHSPGEPRNPVP